MKKLLAFVLGMMLVSASAQQITNVLYGNVGDYSLNAQRKITVTSTLLYPNPRYIGTILVRQDDVSTSTDNSGFFAFTNQQWGQYNLTVSGRAGTLFTYWVGTNSQGSIPITSLISNAAGLPPNPATNYYTQAQVNALIAAVSGVGQLLAGANISLTPSTGQGSQVTIASTGGGGGGSGNVIGSGTSVAGQIPTYTGVDGLHIASSGIAIASLALNAYVAGVSNLWYSGSNTLNTAIALKQDHTANLDKWSLWDTNTYAALFDVAGAAATRLQTNGGTWYNGLATNITIRTADFFPSEMTNTATTPGLVVLFAPNIISNTVSWAFTNLHNGDNLVWGTGNQVEIAQVLSGNLVRIWDFLQSTIPGSFYLGPATNYQVYYNTANFWDVNLKANDYQGHTHGFAASDGGFGVAGGPFVPGWSFGYRNYGDTNNWRWTLEYRASRGGPGMAFERGGSSIPGDLGGAPLFIHYQAPDEALTILQNYIGVRLPFTNNYGTSLTFAANTSIFGDGPTGSAVLQGPDSHFTFKMRDGGNRWTSFNAFADTFANGGAFRFWANQTGTTNEMFRIATDTNESLVPFQVVGSVIATSFSGDGSALTALNGSQVATGTIPLARESTNVVIYTGLPTPGQALVVTGTNASGQLTTKGTNGFGGGGGGTGVTSIDIALAGHTSDGPLTTPGTLTLTRTTTEDFLGQSVINIANVTATNALNVGPWKLFRDTYDPGDGSQPSLTVSNNTAAAIFHVVNPVQMDDGLNVNAGISGNGAGLVNLTADNLTGTIPHGVLPAFALTNNWKSTATVASLHVTSGETNDTLTANTLVKADANKKLASIANGVGVLTNDTSGNFGYAQLLDASALKASQFMATDANTNPASTMNGYSLTNLNTFDAPTNLFTGTTFQLGTNTFILSASNILFTALGNLPGVGIERYGQFTVIATADIIVTNPVAWKSSDMLLTRTCTNGNSMVIAVDVIQSVVTNFAVTQFH